jgi:hypothetical protein
MKFPYARFGSYYMPVIPITLSRGDRVIVTEALVDSGAAGCLFDAQFAPLLGIDRMEDGVEVHFEGASGHRLVGYRHSVTLEVGGHRFPKVPISFSSHMPDNAVNILGQQGFFDLCPILFTLQKKEIDIML